MARTTQILLLLLFAAAVQCYGGRRYHGRSHGRYRSPNDYYRHRSSRHGSRPHDNEHTKHMIANLHKNQETPIGQPFKASAMPEGDPPTGLTAYREEVNLTGDAIPYGNSAPIGTPNADSDRSVSNSSSALTGTVNNDKPDDVTNIHPDELPPSPEEPDHNGGTNNVDGSFPSGSDRPSSGDGGDEDVPHSGGNLWNELPSVNLGKPNGTITVDGLATSQKNKKNDGSSSIGDHDKPDHGGNSINIDGGEPSDSVHVRSHGDGSINVNGSLPNDGSHVGSLTRGGENNKPDHLDVDGLSPGGDDDKPHKNNINGNDLSSGGDDVNGHGNIDVGGRSSNILGKPDHNKIDAQGLKPDYDNHDAHSIHKPDFVNTNIGGLPSGDISVGVHAGLPDASGHIGLPDKSGHIGLPDASGHIGLPDTSGNIGLPDGSGHIGSPNASGHIGLPDATGHNGLPDTSGHIVLPDASGHNSLPDTSGHIGLPDASGHIGFPDTSGNIGLPDTSGHIDFNGRQEPKHKPDHSKHDDDDHRHIPIPHHSRNDNDEYRPEPKTGDSGHNNDRYRSEPTPDHSRYDDDEYRPEPNINHWRYDKHEYRPQPKPDLSGHDDDEYRPEPKPHHPEHHIDDEYRPEPKPDHSGHHIDNDMLQHPTFPGNDILPEIPKEYPFGQPNEPNDVGDKNSSMLIPVLLPNGGHAFIYSSALGNMPSYIIVMINGQPTLIQNPGLGFGGGNGGLLVGGSGGLLDFKNGASIGDISGGAVPPHWINIGGGGDAGIGVLPNIQPPIWIGSSFPNVEGGITGGQFLIPKSEPVSISIPIPRPIPRPIPVPRPVEQPIPIPEPIDPDFTPKLTNIPYPGFSWPSYWNTNPGPSNINVSLTHMPWLQNPGTNLDWSHLINLLLNLSSRVPNVQPKPQPIPTPQPSPYPQPYPYLPYYPQPYPLPPNPNPPFNHDKDKVNPGTKPYYPYPYNPYFPYPVPQPTLVPQPPPEQKPVNPIPTPVPTPTIREPVNPTPTPVPTPPIRQPVNPTPIPQPPPDREPLNPTPIPQPPPDREPLNPTPIPQPPPDREPVHTTPIPQPPPDREPVNPTPIPQPPPDREPLNPTPIPQPPPDREPVNPTPIPQPPPDREPLNPTPIPQLPPDREPLNPTPIPQPPPDREPLNPNPIPQPPPDREPVNPTPIPQPPPDREPLNPTTIPQPPPDREHLNPTPIPQPPPDREPLNPTPIPQPPPDREPLNPTPIPQPPPDREPVNPTPIPQPPPDREPGPGFDKDKDIPSHNRPNIPDMKIPFPKLTHIGKPKPGNGGLDSGLIDILNVLLKFPDQNSNPPKNQGSLIKLLLSILKPGDKNQNLIPNLSEGVGEPDLGNLGHLLLHILNDHNEPNLNVLVEPGMDEGTRANLILLLKLLASNLGNSYSETGYYQPENPLLYFLGHFPCDHPNIQAISGMQSSSSNLWQLLANLYGHNYEQPEIRLDRSTEETDNKPAEAAPASKGTTTTSVDKTKKN